MKVSFRKIALFISILTGVFGMIGCGADANVASNGTANSGSGGSNKPAPNEFPPLATALAEAPFENLDGSKFKVSERKGKVLLLNIWGIWCGPCRAEMPHLVAMQEQYRDKGLEVIGLNIGDQNLSPESVEAIQNFADNFNPKLNYTLARSERASTNEFYKISGQSAVPQSLVVDREGRLRGVFIGGGPSVIGKMKELVAKTMAE